MRGVVAVTGATGFVGAATVRQLTMAGWHVRLLARRYPQEAILPGYRLEVVLGDLEDSTSLRQLVRGCDVIIHSAGLVRASTPLEFFRVNESGTARLLDAAAIAAPSARFLHISSLAAREPHLSPYAASKFAGEKKLAALVGSREWVALRPPAVYGPGDHELLPLFKAAKLGFITYPASLNAKVSTIHVSDLASAIAAFLEIPVWPKTVVEVDDEHPKGHDWTEITAALSQSFDKRLFSYRIPRRLMAPIAEIISLTSAMTKRPQVLSRHKVAELYHPNWSVNSPPLSSSIPWMPRFDLYAGFSDTLKWYRSKSLI